METAKKGPTADLRRLSDLSDYGIPDDRPDVRGWTVDAADRDAIGKVDDLVVDTDTMTVRYLELELDRKALEPQTDRDKHVIVPVEHAHLNRDDEHVYVASLTRAAAAALPEFTGDYASYRSDWTPTEPGTPAHRDRLTRAEEELRIDRRPREGEVRAAKHVETERVREEVPVRREEPVVERRPVSGEETRAAGIGEDEIRMPIVEEEVSVEKRPVVKEELVIGKETREDTQVVDADVRRERIDVDRSAEPGRREAEARKTEK